MADQGQNPAPLTIVYEVPLVFRGDDGDIILRSSDNFDFHVHKLMLSKASPVFENMLQSPPPGTQDGHALVLQIVEMTEPANVLDLLLRLCYPMDLVEIEEAAQVHPLLAALFKYEMDKHLSRRIRGLFLSFVKVEPVRVYATAVVFGMISSHYKPVDEVRQAARLSLRHQLGNQSVDQLSGMSAAHYHRLIQYHFKCRNALNQCWDSILELSNHLPEKVIWRNGKTTRAFGGYVFSDCSLHTCTSKRAPSWRDSYNFRAKAVLEDSLWGPLVENEMLWRGLVADLMPICVGCAQDALQQMHVYTKNISKEVENVIDKVSPYPH